MHLATDKTDLGCLCADSSYIKYHRETAWDSVHLSTIFAFKFLLKIFFFPPEGTTELLLIKFM